MIYQITSINSSSGHLFKLLGLSYKNPCSWLLHNLFKSCFLRITLTFTSPDVFSITHPHMNIQSVTEFY